MGYLQSGTPHAGGSVTSFNLTVPSGVASTDHVLIWIEGLSSGATGADCSASSPGATFAVLKSTQVDDTVWATAIEGVGLTPGNTITVTLSVARQVGASHHYYDKAFGTPSAWGVRTSGTTTVAPSITAAAGQTVAGFGAERSSATPTSVSSAVNSGGSAVTQRYAAEDAGNPLCHHWVGDFVVPTAGPSGTLTLSYANTSTGGLALLVPLVDPTPPATGQITTSLTSGVGEDHLRTGWVTLAGATVRMVASLSSGLTSPVFSASTTVPASGWVTRRIDGLDPDTQYYLGLEVNGVVQTDRIMAARTLPADGSQASFSVVYGSCQLTGSNHASLARVALEDALALLHFGDLHYADATTESVWRAAVLSSLSSANMEALTAAMPLLWGWDNHDWGGDLSWSGSAAAAFVPTAYRELHGDLVDSVGYWRTWAIGRVRFIRTDQHSQRSNPADPDGASKVLLGATQKQWWKDTLEAATEPIIIWASGWPNHNMANGRWQTYTTDVNDMEAWLDARPSIKSRLVCIGGDSHDVRADSGTRPAIWQAFAGLPSLNVSPFNQAGSVGETQSWDIGQVDIDDARGAFGRLTFTDLGDEIQLLWEAVLDDGTVLLDWERTFPVQTNGTISSRRPRALGGVTAAPSRAAVGTIS